ncbi:MAG TPA: hypothetical protein VJW94_18155 [Candidatus Acidoferrum sp.]|nr:hypothetical protein [Candidatus Acidoferrum sp.]
MPRAAKVYISLVLCSGGAVLLVAAGSWSSASLPQFVVLLGFAAASSTLKIRIPGIESTLSPNFVFLLLAMLCCSFSEVVAIALVAALVQSLWAAKRARLIQMAFSAAALVLSASVALLSTRFLLGSSASNSPVVSAVLAGSLYLPLNTALVSTVIGLVEGRSWVHVGRICYESVFPYFMGGIVFAGLVSGAFTRSTVWQAATVLFPVTILGYLYSLSRTPTVAAVAVPSVSGSAEERELVEVGSPRSPSRR